MNDRFIDITLGKANTLKRHGYPDQALALIEDALSLYPASTELQLQQSICLFEAGRYDDLLVSIGEFSLDSPEQGAALYKIGCLLAAKGQYQAAIAAFVRAVAADSSNAWAYNNMGICLMELGKQQEAHAALCKAIELKPESSEFQNHFANMCMQLFRLSDAIRHYLLALDQNPGSIEACSNLARAYRICGDSRALTYARKALSLDPASRAAVDILLFSLNYLDEDPQLISDEHKKWAPAVYHAEPAEVTAVGVNQYRIRVGYVSADFRSHPVAAFFEPVLVHYDRNRFDVYCYAQVPNPDTTTERLKNAGGVWRSTVGLTDQELECQVRQDRIDILVDLSGFTEGNRLGTFVLKPAPVQCSWLGYPNTTGLQQIDYRITDSIADPPGMTERFYTETLIRLPHTFLCYLPGNDDPPPPCPSEPITFCSFNNLAKVSDTLISLWAAILRKLPDARLLLKSAFLADTQVCRLVLDRFQARGVETERIALLGWTATRQEHLKIYGGCHIALDSYPYHGTTTTCEALWMGLPVVSLAGSNHVSRVGASILTSIGASELIATSPDEYVSLATGLARDHERLTRYRQTLRSQMQASALMNAPGFVSDLENAFVTMVRKSHMK